MAPRQRLAGLWVLFAVTTLVPSTASAQWVEAPGKGWVQLSGYYHDTEDEFSLDRGRGPIRNGGHAVSTSLFLTAAVGAFHGLDLWLQAPYHSITYTDFGGERERSGLGDIKTFVRIAPLSWLGSDFPVALRAGVKFPVGDFPLDAEIVPLGEGQRDWEVIAEVGHSFYPRAVYAMAWVGYRWREFSTKLNRDFGDEPFFLAAVGGNVKDVGYKVTVEGWKGRTPLIENIRIESASREMLHVTPTLSYPVSNGSFEGGVRIPLAGRNLTAGPAVTVGYFYRFGGQ